MNTSQDIPVKRNWRFQDLASKVFGRLTDKKKKDPTPFEIAKENLKKGMFVVASYQQQKWPVRSLTVRDRCPMVELLGGWVFASACEFSSFGDMKSAQSFPMDNQ